MNSVILCTLAALGLFVGLSQAVNVPESKLINEFAKMQQFADDLKARGGPELSMRQLIERYGSQDKFENNVFMHDEEENFIGNHLYLTLDESKFSCVTSKMPQYIGVFRNIVDKSPGKFTEPFIKYIREAERRIAAHCLRELSANDWAGVEQLLDHENDHEEADIVQTFLADKSFPREPKDMEKDFNKKLADRVDATAKELGIPTERVFNALIRMRWFVDDYLANLGQTLPVDKFNRRVKNMYDANIIWKRIGHKDYRYSKDLEVYLDNISSQGQNLIANVAAADPWKNKRNFDLLRAIRVFAADTSQRRRMTEDAVKSNLKKYCTPEDENGEIVMRLAHQGILLHVSFHYSMAMKMGFTCEQALRLL